MHVKALALGQPLQHLGMFVGGVVVQHHMILQVGRDVGIDLLEEFQPLNVGVAWLALRDDTASRMLSAANSVGVPWRL